MDEGHFARHIRRMRTLYHGRRNALVESIKKELGSTVEVLGSEAGMHLPVVLANGIRDLEISERAARQNLWLWPLSSYYEGRASRSGFILGLGSAGVEEIPSYIRQLGQLLARNWL